MAIEKVLTLSTAHIDPDVVVPAYMVDSHQDFSFLTLGALRNSSHEYGWVVYV